MMINELGDVIATKKLSVLDSSNRTIEILIGRPLRWEGDENGYLGF
jgi:hypothetical protein